MKLIKEHFRQSDIIILQTIGSSCPGLVAVASIVCMKGYGHYKKIKNDYLTVPVPSTTSDKIVSNFKKVRLTVKI